MKNLEIYKNSEKNNNNNKYKYIFNIFFSLMVIKASKIIHKKEYYLKEITNNYKD